MSSANSELFNALRVFLTAKRASFFCNFARLSTVLYLIKKYTSESARVVDLGCGAFVLDFLLESQGYRSIIAIDRTQDLREIYQELRGKYLLRHTLFYQSDITQRDIINYVLSQEGRAELVILNDALFYSRFTLHKVVPQISQILANGGYFIFDIWNLDFYQRFHVVYNLLYPQYRQYRKYRIREIIKILNESGFEIEEMTPDFSDKLMLRLAQKAVWYLSRQSNTVYVVARKMNEG